MPDVLWPLFRENRHLLHDLPVLGAAVLQRAMGRQHAVRRIIIVIPHTFGRHLNFNCHLHMLVSEGGLREDGAGWADGCRLDRQVLMRMWRFAVVALLRAAARKGVLRTTMSPAHLDELFAVQSERWWNTHIKGFRGKTQFLAYAGRYARRPPIAQHRFRMFDRQEIRFVTKDTRAKRIVETVYTPDAFLRALADHIPDRYRHGVRYFGLWSPRVKGRTHDTIFAFLRQPRRPKPARDRWAPSLLKCFGVDPLVDQHGHRMHWARRLPPIVPRQRLSGI
jgi:hypothetical protein